MVGEAKLCRKQFVAQAGIGKKRWAQHLKAAANGSSHPPIDHRSKRQVRNRPAQEVANRFFRWSYQHEAETLPDLRDVHAEPMSSDEDEAMPAHVVMPVDPQEAQSSSADPFAMSAGSSTEACPKNQQKQNLEERHLSWNSYSGFYRQYCAMAGLLNLAVVSLSLFWNVYKTVWSSCLKFRASTQHGKCDECEDFKEHLRKCKSKADEEMYTRDYTKHQREQFADRGVYYNTRAASESFFQWIFTTVALLGHMSVEAANSTITLIIDGMDQAKFRCPRTIIVNKNNIFPPL